MSVYAILHSSLSGILDAWMQARKAVSNKQTKTNDGMKKKKHSNTQQWILFKSARKIEHNTALKSIFIEKYIFMKFSNEINNVYVYSWDMRYVFIMG